jgi:hypothetical protein
MTAPADVRAWLRESGEEVSARGPLAQADIDRYEAAHAAGPDWDAADDANFGDEPSEAGPPPPEVEAERKPRTVATPKPAARLGGWRKARTRKPKGKARPRVPVDDLIAGVWRGLAGFARPLPATSRLLKIQAPVAGVILEDTVKGTVVDHWLQPLARTTKGAEAVFALLGPPVLVTAIQLQPDSAPFILPVLRESMLMWCRVAGPKMADAMKREVEFEAEFGQNVDELLAFLFSDPATAQSEEERVRKVQEAMQGAAA